MYQDEKKWQLFLDRCQRIALSLRQTKMKKVSIILFFFLVAGLLIISYERFDRRADTILVGTSFHPLAEFVGFVGGERVEIFNSAPPGVDPHEFEPTARDLARLYSADLFFHMGAGIDPWADGLDLPNVRSVRMTDRFELKEDDDDHGDEDPHIWLDPILAKSMVEVIRDALTEVDEEGKSEYEKNAATTLLRLDELHESYEAGLSSCELEHLVISHASLGYLAHRYDFNMIAVSGLSPEEEPSARKMAEISDLVKNEGLGHIFFETTMSPAIADTIARETGAEVLVFNNLETLSEADVAAGKDYFSVMEDNLELIRTALRCR